MPQEFRIPLPKKLARLLKDAGLVGELALKRDDGKPPTEHDLQGAKALLVGYEVDEGKKKR